MKTNNRINVDDPICEQIMDRICYLVDCMSDSYQEELRVPIYALYLAGLLVSQYKNIDEKKHKKFFMLSMKLKKLLQTNE